LTSWIPGRNLLEFLRISEYPSQETYRDPQDHG